MFLKKKSKFENDQTSQENKTNMDIILLFLAKPLDKHDITLVHITYPSLILVRIRFSVFLFLKNWSLIMPGTRPEGIWMGYETRRMNNVGV